jgi:hypothetical protein
VVDDPALSLPVAARRPWALIIVVLLIDLGLAAAGIWMLTQGVSERPGRSAPPRSGALVEPKATLPSDLAGQRRSISLSARRVAWLAGPTGAPPSPARPS